MQRQIEHITWPAMPLSSYSSSKPSSNVFLLTSMQASPLGKRAGGRPCELHEALGTCFVSFSSIVKGAWLYEEVDIEIENLIGLKMGHISNSNAQMLI